MIGYWNLSNQAKLVVEEIPYLRSAAIGVFIKVGSRHEDTNLAGASHFVEHMLFKGTEQRSARDIAETFEGIGGQLNAYTSREYTCVYARTLDEHMDMAMEIIFDMLFNSELAEKDFSTEREVIIEEINMYEDTPDELIHDVFNRKFWEGHQMGSSILGTMQTITEMKRNELFDYYREKYVPSNMVIAIAGNIKQDQVKEKIENLLQNIKDNKIVISDNKPEEHCSFINLVAKDTEQVQICLGVPGISYHNENRYTQNVMNSILGGGMSSRLFQNIREELGLAYSVYSFPSSYSDTGAYCIYIGTGPGKLGKFFAALHEQLTKFANEGVSRQEMARTQQLNKSSMLLGLESVMNRMNRIAKSVMMYDKIISPEEVIERMYNVEADMVKEFAASLFKPGAFSLAAIGSKDVLPMVEKEYLSWWG
ncbi:MAG: pitrilysin family protein [Syntrophomonas sp.]